MPAEPALHDASRPVLHSPVMPSSQSSLPAHYLWFRSFNGVAWGPIRAEARTGLSGFAPSLPFFDYRNAAGGSLGPFGLTIPFADGAGERSVTCVLGTNCYPCLRAKWQFPGMDSNHELDRLWKYRNLLILQTRQRYQKHQNHAFRTKSVQFLSGRHFWVPLTLLFR